MEWFVYIIQATDGTYYTGITTDIERRWSEHSRGIATDGAASQGEKIAPSKGAKYFRGRAPQQLVYIEGDHNRSTATKREMEIKRKPRAEKILLLTSAQNQIASFTKST
jgi:putative endonuclease